MARPTLNQIYERIRADMSSRVTGGVKIPTRSLLGILAIVFAGAMHLLYGFLEWWKDQLLPDLATTIGLERWANILGLPKKAAEYTTGTIRFFGTPGEPVPIDTSVQNPGGFEYTTDAEIILDGFTGIGTGTVTAIDAGSDYNTEEADFVLTSPVPEINTACQNIGGFDDGEDEEPPEDLRARLLQRLQNPPSSGTREDYVRWALESDVEVGKAWCFAAAEWRGTGTVGVGVAQSNLDPVSPTTLTAVETYVDTKRPPPAEVDYFNVTPVPVVYTISISPNNTAIQQAITTNLTNLHIAEAAPAGTILLSRMRTAIAASGVSDYEITDITVSGLSVGVDSVTTTGTDVAQFSGASYSVL